MIGRVKVNPLKAPVSSEKITLLSAVQCHTFDQQQIRLISASYYLHCPWFDTNFRIILPRFTGLLAGLSQPVLVNKGPAHELPLDGNPKPRLCVCVSYPSTAGRGKLRRVVTTKSVQTDAMHCFAQLFGLLVFNHISINLHLAMQESARLNCHCLCHFIS